MRKIFRNSLLFLDYQQGDILSAGFIIMFLSMISGAFGFLRDRLLASHFTTDLVGIYFAAFVIPDNIFQILILSTIGAAFIPIFTRYQKLGRQWEITQTILSISLPILLILIIVISFFIEPLSRLLVPGIQKENPQHILLLTNLTRIILLAQLFFVFSYIATGVLQSYQRFIIPALAPIFYNIGIVVGIIFLTPAFGMYGVAIGIVIGAFLHLAIQLPFLLRLGFRINLIKFNLSNPVLKEIGLLMSPRALSIAIERAKLTIDTSLSSLISISSITYLNFALHVATFPVSLVASAIAQAAFPFFAKAASENNIEDFRKHMMLSLMHIVFLLAPASILLIVFHTPVVRLIFGGPLFPWEATVLTARTLAILCIGLIAQGASNILARGFYALFDTKTPLVMTLISTLISILLSYLFIIVLNFDVRALAASTTIGAFINALALFILLHKKVGGLANTLFFGKMLKIFVISGVLGLFAYSMLKALEKYFNTTHTIELFLFTLLVTIVSIGGYIFLSFVFNLEEYKNLFAFFQKAGTIHQKVFGKETHG